MGSKEEERRNIGINDLNENDWNQAYSFHTFLLPFTYQSGNKNSDEDRVIFENQLVKYGAWHKVICETEQLPEIVDACPDVSKQFKLSYATFQYFNPAGRAAMLGADEGGKIVSQYLFTAAFCTDEKQKRRPMRYQITLPDALETTYDLPIHTIRLKVYDNGVAVLVDYRS